MYRTLSRICSYLAKTGSRQQTNVEFMIMLPLDLISPLQAKSIELMLEPLGIKFQKENLIISATTLDKSKAFTPSKVTMYVGVKK